MRYVKILSAIVVAGLLVFILFLVHWYFANSGWLPAHIGFLEFLGWLIPTFLFLIALLSIVIGIWYCVRSFARRFEDSTMGHGIVLSASIVAGLSVSFLRFAGGYFANPDLLGPLDLLILPFIVLPLVLLSFMFAIWYCVRFFTRKKTVRSGMLALAALIILAVPMAMPDTLEAFAYRMKSFSEDEFVELAMTIKKELDQQDRTSLGLNTYERRNNASYKNLVEYHPILAFSSFPPRFSAHKNYVVIWWGSGLLGGYEVTILLAPGKPGWRKEPPYSPVIYIYDRVAVELLP